MKEFYSNGKLLLTGEYAVLDGAVGLAIPTKFGQSLQIHPTADSAIHWQSLDKNNKIWYEDSFRLPGMKSNSKKEESSVLSDIFYHASLLNPSFGRQGAIALSQLTFPRNWGLGSSSTLISNIAQWAQVDVFELLDRTFGGSGYDVTAAQHNHPILFSRNKEKINVSEVHLKWEFTNQIFFVYLNKKMNSRQGIEQYSRNRLNSKDLQRISDISEACVFVDNLEDFESLLMEHELILSKTLSKKTVKEDLFPDYPNTLKSLGAWGGDFILATGNKENQGYFLQKGYPVVISYNNMVKFSY